MCISSLLTNRIFPLILHQILLHRYIRLTCLVVKCCAAGGIFRTAPKRAVSSLYPLQRPCFTTRTDMFRFLRFPIVIVARCLADRVLGATPKLSVPAVSQLQDPFAALRAKMLSLHRNIQLCCHSTYGGGKLRLLCKKSLQTFTAVGHAV